MSSRGPHTVVARAHMCTYAAKVWDLSVASFKGHFLSPPCPKP